MWFAKKIEEILHFFFESKLYFAPRDEFEYIFLQIIKTAANKEFKTTPNFS